MLPDREHRRNSNSWCEVVRACPGHPRVRFGVAWGNRCRREELHGRAEPQGETQAKCVFHTDGHQHADGLCRRWKCEGLRGYRKWPPQTVTLGLILFFVGALLSCQRGGASPEAEFAKVSLFFVHGNLQQCKEQ